MTPKKSPLWYSDVLVESVSSLRVIGDLPDSVDGVSIDSRSLTSGDVFFAVRGESHDGHAFVSDALLNGASCAVVSESELGQVGDARPLIVVDDVMSALNRLAVASRSRTNARIVAVTGSVGKTSTKEILRSVLSACGETHASESSYNNHWGVPLSLSRMPESASYGVFEIGMNHPGEITPLVKLVRPHISVITNVAASHLGHFGSIDEIAHAKAEIFSDFDGDGIALLNRDDERFGLLSSLADESGINRIVSFGESDSSDISLSKLVLHASCSCLTADVFGVPIMAKVGLSGRHMAENVLVALGVVSLFDADLARASLSLSDLRALRGRGERHKLVLSGGTALLIDESYNANPVSMSSALSLFGSLSVSGRRIAVLGDMLELGDSSADYHSGLAPSLVSSGVDIAYLVGVEMKALESALSGSGIMVEWRPDVDSITPLVADDISSGDVIITKASNGIRFVRLVEFLLERFGLDEVEDN